eukprot:3488989-Rhodomonas_salina.1
MRSTTHMNSKLPSAKEACCRRCTHASMLRHVRAPRASWIGPVPGSRVLGAATGKHLFSTEHRLASP